MGFRSSSEENLATERSDESDTLSKIMKQTRSGMYSRVFRL